MNKERQILIVILAFLTLSIIVSILNISLKTSGETESLSLSMDKTGPGIGVIRIYEPISTGGGGGFNVQSGSDAIVDKLDRYMKNPRIRAIVVRINSPGGSVSATQEIFQKIIQIRRKNKPVVASMGDIAASGGYYIASACDTIYANPGTLTGSIGVIISSPSFKKLFEEWGIDMNVIKSGKYKDILSSSRVLEDDERQLLQEVVDISYKQFLKDVSLGRNIPIADFSEYADGRVFTGIQAQEYGLVDTIGSYEDAVAEARQLAQLDENAPVYLDTVNPMELFLESLGNRFGLSATPIPVKSYSLVEYRYNP